MALATPPHPPQGSKPQRSNMPTWYDIEQTNIGRWPSYRQLVKSITPQAVGVGPQGGGESFARSTHDHTVWRKGILTRDLFAIDS